MRDDVSSIKKGYESIEIPPELDLVLEKAVQRGRKAKRNKRIMRPVAAIVALVLVFVLSVNISPVFARFVGNLPGMGSIVDLVSFDRGLIDIVDHGLDQTINKSVTDNGITVTLESAIFDGRKLVLAIKIEPNKDFAYVTFKDLSITDSSGEPLPLSYTHGYHDTDSARSFWALVDVNSIEGGFPNSMILECQGLEHLYTTENMTQTSEIITGNWSIPFSLDTELLQYEPIVTELNSEVSVGNLGFTIERMSVFPTVAELVFAMNEDNPLRITGFDSLRIEDDEGNQYSFTSLDEGVYRFESNYFVNPGQLTLKFDGVYTMPWQDNHFIIDIENERVLDDGGVGIEFLRKSLWPEYDGKDITVWFKVTDAEFMQAKNKHIWVDFEVEDLGGNPYPLSFFTMTSAEEGCYGLGFNADAEIPSVIKVKILGLSKGIREAVEVPLK